MKKELVYKSDVAHALMQWMDEHKREHLHKQDIAEVIMNLPSAEKTGKWIHRISPDEYHCGILECPFCGWEEVDTEHLICCARCGARMVGSEEKE